MKLNHIIEICVAIDIAILGIAYPIIVDKIASIGEKFSSNYLSEIFIYEFPEKKVHSRYLRISWFKITLFITISLFIFLIIELPPLFQFNIAWADFILNNSAKILVLLWTILLTIMFFRWLDKIVLFNGKATKLLTTIIRKYKKLEKEDTKKSYYRKTINEFTIYALNKPDKHIQENLVDFYYDEFSRVRKTHSKKKPIVYSNDLYQFVYELNSEVSNKEKVDLPTIEHRAVSGLWLLGNDLLEIPISKTTYIWLWRNIIVISKKEDYIKMYWSTAHQYFNYRLNEISTNFDFEKGETINKKPIKYRRKERYRFLEFHYALGGLLLYKNQYGSINYIFIYSQSIPPKQVLLPQSINEIFFWFEEFRNTFKKRSKSIDTKYYFPGLDNLGNMQEINYWICRYIGLLFIRQINKFKESSNVNIDYPTFPENIIELNNWLDGLEFFEKCVLDNLKDEKLKQEIDIFQNFEIETEEIKTFFKNVRERIIEKIGREKLKAPISETKKQQFYSETKRIIKNAFKKYDKVLIPLKSIDNIEETKTVIQGISTTYPKSAFIDNDIPNINFDTVIGDYVAKHIIKKYIPNSFLTARTSKYLFQQKDLNPALKKLIPDNDSYVIVAVNTNYEIRNQLKEFEDITEYIESTQRQVSNTLFILKKSDLPRIIHKELKDEELNNLDELDKDLKLYAAVEEIENEKINLQNSTTNNPKELKVEVKISVAFLTYIVWLKDKEVVQISIQSQFKEQGVPNRIKDIKQFRS
tara:strand:- start:393 stop:2654 length:2262 start_codon:yes stop_codon:yes gene_type:complete